MGSSTLGAVLLPEFTNSLGVKSFIALIYNLIQFAGWCMCAYSMVQAALNDGIEQLFYTGTYAAVGKWCCVVPVCCTFIYLLAAFHFWVVVGCCCLKMMFLLDVVSCCYF